MNHGVFDLSWLARRAKDLPLPDIRFVSGLLDHASGSYWRPGIDRITTDEWRRKARASNWPEVVNLCKRNLIYLGDEIVSCARGLIAVDLSAIYDEKDIPAAIAHEWRHHWQAFNMPPHVSAPYFPTKDYRTGIVQYFRSSGPEADALRFESTVAPCDTNLERAGWMGWPTRRVSYSVPEPPQLDFFDRGALHLCHSAKLSFDFQR